MRRGEAGAGAARVAVREQATLADFGGGATHPIRRGARPRRSPRDARSCRRAYHGGPAAEWRQPARVRDGRRTSRHARQHANHLAAPRGLRSKFEDYGFDERAPAKKKKSRRGRSDKQRFTALHTDDPGGAPYDDVEEAEARELRLRELYPEVVDPPFSEGRLDEMASPTPGGGGGNARRMGCAAGICAVLSVLAILGGLLFGGGLQVSLAKPSSAQAVVGATMPPPASPPRSAATRAHLASPPPSPYAIAAVDCCRRRLPCRRDSSPVSL